MVKPIPDRWLNYKPIGEKIEGTPFIAFKVPLRKQVTENIDVEVQLDTQKLIESIPALGLVIDLTNTTRYYNPADLKNKNIKYAKVAIPGKITPSQKLVKRFNKHVREFMKNNKDNLIGVHCTHGVNRTGYLICSFLITELKFQPSEAIKKFNEARGHQIERENYLTALYNLDRETGEPEVDSIEDDDVDQETIFLEERRKFPRRYIQTEAVNRNLESGFQNVACRKPRHRNRHRHRNYNSSDDGLSSTYNARQNNNDGRVEQNSVKKKSDIGGTISATGNAKFYSEGKTYRNDNNYKKTHRYADNSSNQSNTDEKSSNFGYRQKYRKPECESNRRSHSTHANGSYNNCIQRQSIHNPFQSQRQDNIDYTESGSSTNVFPKNPNDNHLLKTTDNKRQAQINQPIDNYCSWRSNRNNDNVHEGNTSYQENAYYRLNYTTPRYYYRQASTRSNRYYRNDAQH